MNFFAEQQRARRRSRVALLLFLAATAIVVFVTSAAVVAFLAMVGSGQHEESAGAIGLWQSRHPEGVWLIAGAVAAAVACASLLRMATLRAGGSAVARSLGGQLLSWEHGEQRYRPLLNVVEEMAIACGIPAPDVYVLDSEGGINAFAAGYTPSDAVIGITRGALEALDRDELQGVVAHEFGHIMNGDMRLNTRLIGMIFGIQVIALAGRTMLRAFSRRGSASGSRDRNAAPLLLLALALFLIGSIGDVLATLIRAAVSRQREFLADACAVQFTRNPAGIAGALKKIAAFPLRAAMLSVASREISHMLIAESQTSFLDWFSSHPPILSRIRAIEPSFRASELAQVRVPPMTHGVPAGAAGAAPAPAVDARTAASLIPLMVVARIGNPGADALALARRHRFNAHPALIAAARARSGAPDLVLALLLSRDALVRERQLARAVQTLGADMIRRERLDALVAEASALEADERRPLLEVAFPALRHASTEALRALETLSAELPAMDAGVTVVDFALARLLRMLLREARQPQPRAVPARKLYRLRAQLAVLFAVMANSSHAQESAARAAFAAGIKQVLPHQDIPYGQVRDWPRLLDQALDALDALAPFMKEELVKGLVTTMRHDHQLTLGEIELFRAVCASLHCPVPPFE